MLQANLAFTAGYHDLPPISRPLNFTFLVDLMLAASRFFIPSILVLRIEIC